MPTKVARLRACVAVACMIHDSLSDTLRSIINEQSQTRQTDICSFDSDYVCAQHQQHQMQHVVLTSRRGRERS